MHNEKLVMFVDDDERILDTMRRNLYREPYRIITSSSAITALEIIREHPVAVVVADQKMPIMCGTDFLMMVKKNFPDTIRIMLTGEADLDTAIGAINRGEIYRFFVKPTQDLELGIAIRQALQHHELLSAARQLLQTLKMQSTYIEHLEEEFPGITSINRSETGVVIIDQERSTIEDLLNEIELELAKSKSTKVPIKNRV